MKADTERKKYHKEKLHKRKKRLNVHLSKELRSKVKKKIRSLLVHKGDTVKVMRGPGKGKQAKVSRVSTLNRKVYVEGVVAKTARGRESPIALEPSNLLLIGLETTKERKGIFATEAFKEKKAEKSKKKEEKQAQASAPKPAPKALKPEEAKKPEKAQKPEAAKPPSPASTKPVPGPAKPR